MAEEQSIAAIIGGWSVRHRVVAIVGWVCRAGCRSCRAGRARRPQRKRRLRQLTLRPALTPNG
jgi:hypothetical protein